MDQAKKKVIEDGYVFAKGNLESSLENSPIKKRVKLSSEEKTREIGSLKETLKVLSDRLMFKKRQLEKEKFLQNLKQYDQKEIC